jgi:hypothetical protein
MSAYAAQTDVPADRSRGEIERIVTRFGARSFAYGWEGTTAVIGFELGERHYRFSLPLPDPTSSEFWLSPTGRERTAKAAEAEHAQAVRQRWRALALIVKAKFAAVEAGISTVEIEFMPNVVLPDGRTVGDHTLPAIAKAYAENSVPSMLALPAGGNR